MLLPGRSDGEETTGEATAVSAMTGNDRRAERASNDEPDGTAQATTGLTTLPLAHLSVGLTRTRSATAGDGEHDLQWMCFHRLKRGSTPASGWLRECGFVDSTRGVTGRSDITRWDLQKRTNARRTGRTRAMQWGLPRLKAE